MYVKVNLNKQTGVISPGSAAPKRNKVIIVDVDDILVFPPRDGNSVNMLGNFVMKPNAKMIEFYVTKSKISAPFESDGDEDSTSIKQMFECQTPGNELNTKEFVQNWLGVNCIIIHESCSDNFKEVIGTPCAPVQMKPSKTDNNDGRFFSLKFEQFAKSAYLPGHYTGEYIFAEPFAIADAEGISLLAANGNQYKLPASAIGSRIDIVGNDLPHGSVFTFIGSGGIDPCVINGVNVLPLILKSGTSWTAFNGAVIQFEVFVAGPNTYFFELSRG